MTPNFPFPAGTRQPRIVVLGSLVFDLAISLDRMPATHETVLARDLHVSCGGKGLCQAVAAARLGADVQVVGRVGDDVFAGFVLETLERNGIDHAMVGRDPAGTHIGVPMVTPDGNNRIIGIPRASNHVDETDVMRAQAAIDAADVLVVQCETPLPAVSLAIELAGRNGTTVVWNPAPAMLSLAQVAAAPHGPLVTWLTPNETEASALAGCPVTNRDEAIHAARTIREAMPRAGVIVTLGAQGAVALDPSGHVHPVDPVMVQAVDPTGAGDAFTGAFAAAMAHGWPLETALQVASAAGALTATRIGAADAMPSRDEILHLLRQPGGAHG